MQDFNREAVARVGCGGLMVGVAAAVPLAMLFLLGLSPVAAVGAGAGVGFVGMLLLCAIFLA